MVRVEHMKLKSAQGVIPMTGISQPWNDSPICKHFFPCDGLVGGNIVDVKGGVIAQPQLTKQFVFNSMEKSVLSTAPGGGAGSAPNWLASGSWAVMPTGVSALFMAAGYVDKTYDVNGSVRIAIGDNNKVIEPVYYQGWGMSDGVASNCQHVQFLGNQGNPLTGNGIPNGSLSTTLGSINTKVGDGTYIIRYALYRPSDGLLQESKVLNSNGASLITNDMFYAGTQDQLGALFTSSFRMSGIRCTGIAVYYFTSATPLTDYLTAVNYNGALWKQGIRKIYAGTGW